MTVGKEAAKGAARKRGLGRGLEALLGPRGADVPPLEAMPGDHLRTLPVDAMVPGKFQPRRWTRPSWKNWRPRSARRA